MCAGSIRKGIPALHITGLPALAAEHLCDASQGKDGGSLCDLVAALSGKEGLK
ncbi:MAG: hypothetical protein ACJARR_002918 [Pseudophaeobacter arcticus]|jgi:hypothetical protein